MERDTERVRRLVAALTTAQLDAFCCRLPHNVLLLTGYWPVLGNSTALFTRAGDVALIVPADELELARQGWVTDEAILSFTPITLEHLGDANEATRPLLAQVGRQLGLARAAIGYEGSPELTPVPYVALRSGGSATLDLYRVALPEANFWDAAGLLGEARAILTSREVAQVRRACAVAGSAFAAARAAIQPGACETAIAAAACAPLEAIALREPGVQRAGGHVFCMSGPRAAEAYRAYARTGTRALEAGDLVLVHMNSYVDGFWTDLTRTYFLGEPDAHHLTIYEAVLTARAHALRAIQQGVLAREVDGTARDQLKQAGFGAAFKHQLGHGVGYGAIYHGNLPRLHPCSDDVLQPGMVFNVEPAVYLDGQGGLRHCDVVAVASDGADLLSPFHGSLDDLIVAA